jgi:hypothetical protein
VPISFLISHSVTWTRRSRWHSRQGQNQKQAGNAAPSLRNKPAEGEPDESSGEGKRRALPREDLNHADAATFPFFVCLAAGAVGGSGQAG